MDKLITRHERIMQLTAELWEAMDARNEGRAYESLQTELSEQAKELRAFRDAYIGQRSAAGSSKSEAKLAAARANAAKGGRPKKIKDSSDIA